MRNKKTFKRALALAAALPFLAFSVVFAQQDRGLNQGRAADQAVEPSGGSSRSEMMAARLTAMARLMQAQTNRAENAFNRLSNILERIESRKDKLAESGADTADLEDLIEQANEHKETAAAALTQAKTELAELPDAENPRLSVQSYMAEVRELKQEMIAWHRSMIAIVREMRDLQKTLTQTEEAE